MATLKHTKQAMREQGFTAPALGELSKSEVADWQDRNMTAEQRASVLEAAKAKDIWGRLSPRERKVLMRGPTLPSAAEIARAQALVREGLISADCETLETLTSLGRAVVEHGKTQT